MTEGSHQFRGRRVLIKQEKILLGKRQTVGRKCRREGYFDKKI